MVKRVLYIEDDIDDQEIMLEILNDKHIQVDFITADNGADGLDKIKSKTHFDLILMDINMPLLNGFDTLKIIRTIPEYTQTPIYILSTSDYFADAELARSLGANSFITKANSYSEMSDIVDRIFK